MRQIISIVNNLTVLRPVSVIQNMEYLPLVLFSIKLKIVIFKVRSFVIYSINVIFRIFISELWHNCGIRVKFMFLVRNLFQMWHMDPWHNLWKQKGRVFIIKIHSFEQIKCQNISMQSLNLCYLQIFARTKSIQSTGKCSRHCWWIENKFEYKEWMQWDKV